MHSFLKYLLINIQCHGTYFVIFFIVIFYIYIFKKLYSYILKTFASKLSIQKKIIFY